MRRLPVAGTRQNGHVRRGGQAGESSAQPTSILRALGLTLAAQVAVAAGTLVLFRLLALNAGAEGFASFSLVRQAVTLLFPVVTVGLVGGLPRYLALRETQTAPPAESYLAAAVGISAAAVAVAAAVPLAFPAAAARLFFGDPGATALVGPFVALLVATAAFHVAYGYFRGQLRVTRSNALQIAGVGVVPPLLVALWPDIAIDTLVLLMAAALGVLSAGSVLLPFVRGMSGRARARVRVAGRTLLHYGVRRVPGELAQVGLFALVPVLTAHVATLRDVAYVAAGLQVLVLVAVAMGPLGVVLLPALARMWAQDRARASRQVAALAALALHVALFALAQAVLFGDLAVRLWLGPAFEAAGTIVRVVVLGVPFYAFYFALRSALDAASVRSYNSRSNFAALGTFVGVAAATLTIGLMAPALCVATAFTAAIAVQGTATFVFVHRVFAVRWSDYALTRALPLAAMTAVAGLAARPLIEDTAGALLLLAGFELVLATAYVAALVGLRVPWTRMVLDVLPFNRLHRD